ncbi:probable Dolichyl pyrophosphate Man9GlcNAc2 alpha-1,3-glucosyltransferase [Saccharomycodes ludwigii]|uniref:Alpha-1,3-glucosyltransferase n=1 Tax=Saccharomycodes ludwigii TaxID=36035 RepID=A0A376B7T5_9ASCO|nr:probable Dolichyl pyrophosphate Man9GlcNAc2 alpha-1,3-glucosyltransferase [Saccharomycodes ludwigii]
MGKKIKKNTKISSSAHSKNESSLSFPIPTKNGVILNEKKEAFYASPLYDFLSPLRPVNHQWGAEYIIVFFALIIRCAVGLGSFSGYKDPPMHGDFEAQRHWLEITTSLPISKWYYYNLEYWGLDYPPLTAYHSYVLGYLGSLINSSWFKLDDSRGLETLDLKSYMRFTVILSEALLYIPGIIYFCKWIGKHTHESPINQYIAAAAILFQPALILIDHGHFQYNSVMLGLTVYAINNILDDYYVPAAICFVLSIGFKQMALFYSPIFFAFLLRQSLFINFPRFILISVATVLTFFAMFVPLYVFGGLDNVLQCLHRIFPFQRGIFEDKVANFWCVSNIVIKYRELFTLDELKMLSLVLTFIGFLPAFVIILLYPKKHLIPYALASSSLSFYLFGFQVHEKTILLPLLPLSLLYTSSDRNVVSLVSWVNNIAVFSLWPLLKKDGLCLQYFAILYLSNWLIGNFSFITPRFFPKWLTPGPSVSDVSVAYRRRSLLPNSLFWKVFIVLSYIIMGAIHLCDFLLAPPDKYPDLWVLLNSALCFGCFVLVWLWTNYKLVLLRNKTFKSY